MNETLFSFGLGLVRSLVYFLAFGVVQARRFHFLFPASELSLSTRNLCLTSPAFFSFSPPFSSPFSELLTSFRTVFDQIQFRGTWYVVLRFSYFFSFLKRIILGCVPPSADHWLAPRRLPLLRDLSLLVHCHCRPSGPPFPRVPSLSSL